MISELNNWDVSPKPTVYLPVCIYNAKNVSI
jgi:hypothetical protein